MNLKSLFSTKKYVVHYVGGHPDITKEMKMNIVVGDKFELHYMFKKMAIDYANIERVEFKTEEQISKDVTLGRLLLFGVLAFGLKKKSVHKTGYLVITYKDEVLGEQKMIFRTKQAGEIASSILKKKKEVLQEKEVLQ